MSNTFEKIGLYDHNAKSYQKVVDAFSNGEQVVGIVHATGTGKTYNALALAYDNPDKKILYIVPSNGIIEHIKEIIESNPNLSLERDFSNVEFRTYQSLVNLEYSEIANLKVDMLILDEFHHLGAPVWGARIDHLINTHPDVLIFGMTAYTVRDRGSSYERDMANPDTEELFSNKIVSHYDLCDAMIDGVLPKPIYRSAHPNLLDLEESLEKKAATKNPTIEEYQTYMKTLNDVKRRIHEASSISEVIKKNVKPNGKYIYFCPPYYESGVNDINAIMNEAKKWFLEMGLTEDNIVFYQTTSQMGELGKLNRLAFYNDLNLDGSNVKNKLRVMFAINQYNEGIHAPNIDGVIMGRGTGSDIVYFEQLGRALSVRGKTKIEFEELEKLPYEKLLEMCQKIEIQVNDNASKEEIIEKLLAPIIIDLTGNYDFIKELENNLKNRVKQIEEKSKYGQRVVKISDVSFDIEFINQDLYEVLENIKKQIFLTWMDKYSVAKIYYEYYGSLDVPKNFKTIDGINYHQGGFDLYDWLIHQKSSAKSGNLSKDKQDALEAIGMDFTYIDREARWNAMYELAKAYYCHYGNLKISNDFKTNNGYDRDPNGQKLGKWYDYQRLLLRKGKLSEEKLTKLKAIGMSITIRDSEKQWHIMYELATAYYQHHGNLEIYQGFITDNGYEENKDGQYKLGIWIDNQRQLLKRGNYPEEKRIKLEKIGMRFKTVSSDERWHEMYALAQNYYYHYGNLEVPYNFKTSNGYEVDDQKGQNLGMWINNQRINVKKPNYLHERRVKLEQIGMRFNSFNEELWNSMYELAKAYYCHYGNLIINQKFKTSNGYEPDEEFGKNLGVWIATQRDNYQKGKISEQRITLLNSIGMVWSIKKSMQNIYKLCDEYSIDITKNASIIEHITYKELKSKIFFLTSNGYSITGKEGTLHEIFSMSSLNMKVNYGLTLEELISRYYSKSSKSKGVS